MPTLNPHLFVIFGATGDLTSRKLIPALYHLMEHHDCEDLAILGVARSGWDDAQFRGEMREALEEFGKDVGDLSAWCEERLYYHSIGKGEDAFEKLAERIAEIEGQHATGGNRVVYLSLPPQAYRPTIEGLGKAGLNDTEGWMRLVIEKPFGHDVDSANELNDLVHEYYDEEQVYRIDHFLGKETVQNLLAFRFGNAIFESVWNRDRIDRIDITVAETIGVGTRAGYYDESGGALRDMIQNHLLQIFCFVAIEAPSRFSADALRREKIKLLDSVAPLDLSRVVYGQYTGGVVDGEEVAGYLEEKGVAKDSATETFAQVELAVRNGRWHGVPFTLRTGKRMAKRVSQVTVHFDATPFSIFNGATESVAPNVLVITMQPDEGFDLYFEVKRPGEDFRLSRQRLRFDYDAAFEQRIPDAYETLLRDIVRGDQALFVSGDEAVAAWALFEPLLQDDTETTEYAAGTWGPEGADHAPVSTDKLTD